MTAPTSSDITEILLALEAGEVGDKTAADLAFEVVYDELRRMAAGIMKAERVDHTLQPTALVHEAYSRLVDQTCLGWQNRAHFFGIAARAMRQILAYHARGRAAAKRGGGLCRVVLDDRLGVAARSDVELIELDEALTRLSAMDERMAKIVEFRVFGGLTAEEVGQVLGVSRRTVQDDWSVAKMWLAHELAEAEVP
jgi:RNA polymerase sigma factor (TIGR02999 family)